MKISTSELIILVYAGRIDMDNLAFQTTIYPPLKYTVKHVAV